jgi:hypothetical protein
MSPSEEFPHDRRADKAGGSGYKDTHDDLLSSTARPARAARTITLILFMAGNVVSAINVVNANML